MLVGDDDRLLGVAYGYVGRPGQWWHDQVRAALDRRTAKRWLPGAFEVCELHVHPDAQSQGLGRSLVDAVVARYPSVAAWSSAPEACEALGFARTGEVRDGQVELAAPLRPPAPA